MVLVLRALALLCVLGALSIGLDGERAEVPTTVTVHASHARGVIDPSIWDEVNLWKLYGWFGVHNPDPVGWWGERWLRERVPWVRYARVVAPLGGSYAPHIARACDHAEETAEHFPTPDCGSDGVPGNAAQNENIRWIDGEWVVDYTPFRESLERLLRSGVKPHINLSGIPVPFSGGTGNFRHYHWNAKPPEDLDGWLAFVRGGFEATEGLDRSDWRISIINEPNCLKPDEDGEVHPVGFAGDPELYAHTWVAAAQMLDEVIPEARVHPGNYVTSDSFPGEDNLRVYLAALREELERDPDRSWDDMPYVGLSLYEVADTSVEEFRGTRIQRLYDAQTANGLSPRRLKLDELGLHENVRRPYDAAFVQDIDTTSFAASWHAEALRSFIDAGDVASTSPWLDAIYVLPEWTLLPTAYVYRMLGLLAGQLEPIDAASPTVDVKETGNDDGLPRVETIVRRTRGASGSTLRTLATRADDGTARLLVIHHQPELVADADPKRTSLSETVRVSVDHLAADHYAVRHASVGGAGGAHWNGSSTTALLWQDDGCHATRGRLELPQTYGMPANSVWLFELAPRDSCEPTLQSGRVIQGRS